MLCSCVCCPCGSPSTSHDRIWQICRPRTSWHSSVVTLSSESVDTVRNEKSHVTLLYVWNWQQEKKKHPRWSDVGRHKLRTSRTPFHLCWCIYRWQLLCLSWRRLCPSDFPSNVIPYGVYRMCIIMFPNTKEAENMSKCCCMSSTKHS